MTSRRALGDFGERVAAAHLEAKGYTILEHNFSVPEAELDLIARDANTLVFVEVRTRRGAADGIAAMSVNHRKAEKLLLAVDHYLDAHPALADTPMRIDVVTVELDRSGAVRAVTHYENAVRA
ncbi:MAG: YraN family protein [Dehalococcoidia bacterium]